MLVLAFVVKKKNFYSTSVMHVAKQLLQPLLEEKKQFNKE